MIDNNKLSIIVFGSTAEIILENWIGVDNNNEDNVKLYNCNIEEIIGKIVNRGSTNGQDAIDKTKEIINTYDDFFNVVFLTDGCFNSKLENVNKFKLENTIFNTIGFTQHHDVDMLNMITHFGDIDGMYSVIHDDQEISSVADKMCNFNDDILYNVTVEYGGHVNKLNVVDYGNWKTCIFDKSFNYTNNTNIIISHNNNIIKSIKLKNSKIEDDNNHLQTHLLRELIVESLINKHSTLELFCKLNDDVVGQLNIYNKSTSVNHIHLRDIKILNQLNMDLDQIITLKMENKIDHGLYLKYYNQHKNQFSISTLKSSSCYGTKQLNLQLIKKLNNDSNVFKNVNLKIDNESKHYVNDNVRCYITMDNWKDTSLGLGLYILPKTTREIKRQLQPNLIVDTNYISVEAYNNGVIHKYEEDPNAVLADPNLEGASEIVRTANGYINCWLPIYINEAHWSNAKYYVDSAVSLILYRNSSLTVTEKAIDVYVNIFVRYVVKFIEEKKVSEKEIEIFGYLYRTLLAIMNNDIKIKVDGTVKDFIQIPHMRSRRYCSNLGDIINLLFISDYEWKNISKYYVPETVRRSVIRIDLNKLLKENTNLIENFSEQTKDFFKVSMFTVHLIRSFRKDTLEETKKCFDDGWGKLCDNNKTIKSGFDKIIDMENIMDKLNFMDFAVTEEMTKDLIIWAIRNKDSNCELVFNKKATNIYNDYVDGKININLEELKLELELEKVTTKKIRKNMIFIFPDSGNKSISTRDDIKEQIPYKCSVFIYPKYGFIKIGENDLMKLVNNNNRIIVNENIYYMDLKRGIKTNNHKSKVFKRKNKFSKVKGQCYNKKYDDFNGFIKNENNDLNFKKMEKESDKDKDKDKKELNITHVKCIDGPIHITLFKRGVMEQCKFLLKGDVIELGEWKIEFDNCDENNLMFVY
jgi:hypothetical protein